MKHTHRWFRVWSERVFRRGRWERLAVYTCVVPSCKALGYPV